MKNSEKTNIASPRHTAILCAILLGVAAIGWLALHSTSQAPAAANPAGLVLTALVTELALLYYVWAGVRRGGLSLRGLAIEGTPTTARVATDIGIGIGLFVLLTAANGIIAKWLGEGDTTLIKPLIAAAIAQPVLWVVLSLAAAVSEELTFRGYLQRQFGAWLGNPLLAIVAQAVLFGVTHGYQGVTLMLRIAILGLILGLAAWARRSTVPGIVAHFALDVAGGLGLVS